MTMIERELLDILEGDGDKGGQLNALADEFREGRNADEFVSLLRSQNLELLSSGLWILGEMNAKFYDFPPLISRLRELTEHQESEVRFLALGALFPFLDAHESSTQTLLAKLRADPNPGVRMAAESATERLSLR